MARILFTWELGGGLGHVVRFAPIVRELTSAGHEVFAAVRDLSRAQTLLGQYGVRYFQAPFKNTTSANRMDPARTYAHILHNTGFADLEELRALAGAWRNLYDFVKPDLIVFDHSPIALLAARTIGAKRVVMGTGFSCPPDVWPLPDFRPWLADASEKLRRDEDGVLLTVNTLLESWQVERLQRLSQLYGQVDAILLTTFAELDPYPHRERAEYYGAWSEPGGVAPTWPNVTGTRIFAYLKPFPGLSRLLEALRQLARPAIVYVQPLDSNLRTQFECPTLRLESERLDLDAVGSTSDLAILNGGHGATALMLLAGKRLLEIPLHLEQALNAAAVVRLNAGLRAEANRPEEIVSNLTTLLQRQECAEGARRFAARYAAFKPQEAIRRIAERIESIL